MPLRSSLTVRVSFFKLASICLMLESCDPVPKGAMQSAVEVTSADPVSVHNMLGVTPFSKAKGACVPKAMIEMN